MKLMKAVKLENLCNVTHKMTIKFIYFNPKEIEKIKQTNCEKFGISLINYFNEKLYVTLKKKKTTQCWILRTMNEKLYISKNGVLPFELKIYSILLLLRVRL